jgi:hypothetical protein
MSDPTPRSFKTECLRYQLARADLVAQYAACIQALADEHGVEILLERSNQMQRFRYRESPDGPHWPPSGPMDRTLQELQRSAYQVGIEPRELVDSDRPHFKPRPQDP